MSLSSKTTFEGSVLSKLQKLIAANLDSYRGFREAAGSSNESAVSLLFEEISSQRKRQAEQLQAVVISNDAVAIDEGTAFGTFHRYWMKFRNSLNGGSIHVTLCEVARGENHIEKLYDQSLVELQDDAVSELLTIQHNEVKRQYALVRAIRDNRAPLSVALPLWPTFGRAVPAE